MRGGSVSLPREIVLRLRRTGHAGARGQNTPYTTYDLGEGEDAASEVTLELRNDEAGQSRAVASLFHVGKECLQMSADRLMKQSPVGLAAAIC